MIIINLLSKDLRKKERKTGIPYKNYLILFTAIVVFLHLVLFSVFAIKKVQLVFLKGATSKVSPQTKEAALAKIEIKKIEAEAIFLRNILSRKAIFTDMLSSLNGAVPKGLWLERFLFSQQGLMIQGSVVSLNQDEMTIIGKFLQELKNNKTFSALFPKIELNSVQRRTIKAYDVVDYVLVGDLKK